MKIEVLYVANCPNHAVALDRLREVLSDEGFQEHVSQILVGDAAVARFLKFAGSPTIRVDGHDVDPHGEHAASFGIMCRLYSDGGGAPSKHSLRAAIDKASGSGV